jgi:hypothetical protein
MRVNRLIVDLFREAIEVIDRIEWTTQRLNEERLVDCIRKIWRNDSTER